MRSAQTRLFSKRCLSEGIGGEGLSRSFYNGFPGIPSFRPKRRYQNGHRMSNARIGFIGIGMMGHGMAKNLLAKGFPLAFLANRDRSRLPDLGAAGRTGTKTPPGA